MNFLGKFLAFLWDCITKVLGGWEAEISEKTPPQGPAGWYIPLNSGKKFSAIYPPLGMSALTSPGAKPAPHGHFDNLCACFWETEYLGREPKNTALPGLSYSSQNILNVVSRNSFAVKGTSGASGASRASLCLASPAS